MIASSKFVGKKLMVRLFTEHFKGCHPNYIRIIKMAVLKSLNIYITKAILAVANYSITLKHCTVSPCFTP
jgi:hypothetical protein